MRDREIFAFGTLGAGLPRHVLLVDQILDAPAHKRRLGHQPRSQRAASSISLITGMPARRLGLSDHGVLREGAIADIVVFDPKTVSDVATFENPHLYPIGVPHVLVNANQ